VRAPRSAQMAHRTVWVPPAWTVSPCLVHVVGVALTSAPPPSPSPAVPCSTIFVEAFREAAVRQAVSGIPDLYGWKPDAITQLPLLQMTDALR